MNSPSRRSAPPRIHPATRWHRLLGMLSLIIVLTTTVSGIIINHTDELGLARRQAQNALVDFFYMRGARDLPQGFATAAGFVVGVGDRTWRDDQLLHASGDAPRGAVVHADRLLVLYRARFDEYTRDGRLVESYDELDGLTPPLLRLGVDGDRIVIAGKHMAWGFDANAGEFSRLAPSAATLWSTAAAPPPELHTRLHAASRGSISWERVLLDFHSGRLLGPFGRWLVDAAAVCLLILAVTGTYMWFKFKRAPPRGGDS